MNLPGREDEELFELIGRWCNGALDGEGMARLDRFLGAGAEARPLFVDHLDMYFAVFPPGLPFVAAGLRSRKGPERRCADDDDSSLRPPVLGFLGDIARWARTCRGCGCSLGCSPGLWGCSWACRCSWRSWPSWDFSTGRRCSQLPRRTLARPTPLPGNRKRRTPGAKPSSLFPLGVRRPAGRRRLSMGRSGIGPRRRRPADRRPEVGVGVRAGGDRLSERGRGEASRTGDLRDPVGQQRFSHDRAAQRPRGHPGVARVYRPLANGGDGGPGDGIQRRRLGRRTQPDWRRRGGGRSAVGQRASAAPPGRGRVDRGRAGHAVGHRPHRAGRRHAGLQVPHDRAALRATTTPTPRKGMRTSAFSAAGPTRRTAARWRRSWTARGNPSPIRPRSRSSSPTILRE